MNVKELVLQLQSFPEDTVVLFDAPYYGDCEVMHIEYLKGSIFDDILHKIV